MKPATSNGAAFTTTLTTQLGARVVDTSSERVCHSVSVKAKGSLTSCAMGKGAVPCRLVSVYSPKCGCGMFRCRRSFFQTCRAVQGGKGLPVLYNNANVCVRTMLGKCELLSIPRGPKLHRSLGSGSLLRLRRVLTNCGILRGGASISATRQTVQTVRVRRCCGGRTPSIGRCSPVGDLVVNVSVSQRLQHRGVSHHLHIHLSRKVIGRIQGVVSSKIGPRSLVCCKLRCGCLALCVVNGLSCRSVVSRLRVSVRRFTGQRVA